MTILEQFNQAKISNSSNLQFTNTNDDILGVRKMEWGAYIKTISDGYSTFIRCVFDDGQHFLWVKESGMLYREENIPANYFIHKHIEKLIESFKDRNLEVNRGIEPAPITHCSLVEVSLQSAIVVRCVIDRDEKIVCLTNFHLPNYLRGRGLGLKLLSQIFNICQKLDYKLYLTEMLETFYNRLVKRGASIIEPYDIVEVTDKTNLGLLID